MFIYVFTRPDNLVIAEGGDTVESGFFDVDLFSNYVVKALNQLAQQADHSAGKGIVLTQDASTKAVTFAVKDWDDISFISKLSEQGLGQECKLLDGVSSLKTPDIKNGKYYVKNCEDTPDKTLNYFLEVFSYSFTSDRDCWQNLYDMQSGERWFRSYSANKASWTSWTPSTNIPTRNISAANIWMEG